MQSAAQASADSSGALTIPAFLFRHQALVLDDQGRPFAEVAETYTGETLNFDRSLSGIAR
jgi:hypothetical protein